MRPELRCEGLWESGVGCPQGRMGSSDLSWARFEGLGLEESGKHGLHGPGSFQQVPGRTSAGLRLSCGPARALPVLFGA